MTAPRENPPAQGLLHDNSEVELARLGEQIGALREAFQSEKIAYKEANAAAFKAAETAVNAALQAQKEAASKAEANQAKQLELHNGLIKKMDALVQNFPTKESVGKDFSTRDVRLGQLERQVARAYGASAGAIGLAGIAVAVILSNG